MRKYSRVSLKETGAMEYESGALQSILVKGKPSGWNPGTAQHIVFELLGELDELNSLLGVVKCCLADGEEQTIVETIQNDLFLIQGEVGEPVGTDNFLEPIERRQVFELAKISGRYEQTLKPLAHFIVPGGTISAALLHYARSVTRRVERSALRYAKQHQLNPFIPPYLDRLACLLFQLARHVNQNANKHEQAPAYYRKRTARDNKE